MSSPFPSSPSFIDGYFGTPVETSKAPAIKRPFKDSIPPDIFARVITRSLLVDPRAFSPRLAARTGYTNYLTYSEDFSNAAWTKTNLTRTAAALANPWDGQSTFSRFLETVTNAEHVLSAGYTFTAVPHVLTALLAPGLSRSFVRLKANDGTNSFSAFFDLVNGQVFGAPSGCTAAIRRYADGSCKCSIFFTPAAAAGNVYVNSSTDGSTVSFAGDTAKGFYCGGVQVERASAAGPYIVTTTAARTVSVPDVDGIVNASATDPDDFALMVGETDVDSPATAAEPLVRNYARLPKQQISPNSGFIDRPILHDIVSGAYYGVSFDIRQKYSWIFSSRVAVSSLNTPDTPSLSNFAKRAALGHVQISITLNTGTTTFYADDADSTIKDALSTAWNGTTSASANFYLGRDTNNLQIKWAGVNVTIHAILITDSTVSTDLVNIPPLGVSSTTGPLNFISNQTNRPSIRTINATAHGGINGDRCVLWNGARIIGTGVVIDYSTDAFDVSIDILTGVNDVVTHCGFARNAAYCVTNGPVEADIDQVTDFYLVGWSILGAATLSATSDIPNSTVQMDPVSWLTAVAAYLAAPSNTAYAVESTQGKKPWMGNIIGHTYTRVQLADVVDSVTP